MKNGQIWCVTPVQDGKEEGIAKEYDKSGKINQNKAIRQRRLFARKALRE